MISTSVLVFAILAVVTVVSAMQVIMAPLITHAALFMALSFVAVAGIFLQFDADFLAAAQVLIYAGAITTMVIFAIMLSDVKEVRQIAPDASWLKQMGQIIFSRRFGLLPVSAAVAFSAVLFAVYSRVPWAVNKQAAPPPSTVQALGQELFSADGYVIPFEVASLILLVAMVGAIILTVPAPGAGNSPEPPQPAAKEGE